MLRYHHLTDGILRPEEVKFLQVIFATITAEPWFDLTDYSRESLAARLIRLYQNGFTDAERLQELGFLTAQAHFGRNTPDEKRRALERLYDLDGRGANGSHDTRGSND